jgi:hypothetical protein
MSPLASESRHSGVIQLPMPANDRATSVFDALKRRRTTRGIGAAPLSLQELSNLLWAACGANRKVGPLGVPGPTSPVKRHCQAATTGRLNDRTIAQGNNAHSRTTSLSASLPRRPSSAHPVGS